MKFFHTNLKPAVLLLFYCVTAFGQAIPSYVSEMNYNTNIDHLNDDNVTFGFNDVAIDDITFTAPNSTVAPSVIRNIRNAVVDGFHRDESGDQYYSFDADTFVGVSPILRSDIIRCDVPACTSFSLVFNAISQNFQGINIDAFTFDPDNGDLIFSIEAAATIDGSSYFPADLIRYDGTDYTLEYDAISSGVGVQKNITSLSMMSNRHFALTFEEDGFLVGGLVYRDHWVLVYSPVSAVLTWFYTIFGFSEDTENPVKINALMSLDNDLIFKDDLE